LSYPEAIAKGLVTGATSWSKIGYNAALGATELDIGPWMTGPYVFPSAEKEMTLVSSAAGDEDNGAAGQITAYTITAGADQGANYTAGDILTITQGGASIGSIKVLTIGAGGEVATSELHTCGLDYSVANDLATTYGGAGSGCLVNITAVSAAASTGARTVTLYYLDDGYVEKTATIVLNGNTPVKVQNPAGTVVTDIFRVNNMRLSTAGTGLVPVGNLTLASGGVTYGYISLGKTRMRQCVWTVPYGKVLYITQIAFSSSNQGTTKYSRFTTRATFDDKTGAVTQAGLFMPFHEVGLINTAYIRELHPPTKLIATVDIKVSAISNDTNVVATCALRGWTETV
jgi:hypothetical protein